MGTRTRLARRLISGAQPLFISYFYVKKHGIKVLLLLLLLLLELYKHHIHYDVLMTS